MLLGVGVACGPRDNEVRLVLIEAHLNYIMYACMCGFMASNYGTTTILRKFHGLNCCMYFNTYCFSMGNVSKT